MKTINNLFLDFKEVLKILFLEQKKPALLKNCDWRKLHKVYCHISEEHYDKLDHLRIVCGIAQLREQCTKPCSNGNCSEYDQHIYTEDAKAIVELIDFELQDMVKVSLMAESLSSGVAKAFQDIPGMPKLNFGFEKMDDVINESYKHLSRIKMQLQK